MKPVTEPSGSDHPAGRPISCSTNEGLRSAVGGPSVGVVSPWRPCSFAIACSGIALAPVRLPRGLRSDGPPLVASVAVGVAQALAITSSPGELRFSFSGPFESRAFGVGQAFATSLRCGALPLGLPSSGSIAKCASGVFWSSLAVGVPQGGPEPEPVAFVRGANGGRRETRPLRIEPELGKVGEDVREPVSNKLGHVLQEDVPRSHVSDDPGNVRPEPSLVIDTSTGARRAERLARETGSDEIHSSAPRCAVEGREIVPDRRLIQVRLFHPGHESGRCVGVPLNVSHGEAIESGESEGKLEPSVA